jgi:hypothetical protein
MGEMGAVSPPRLVAAAGMEHQKDANVAAGTPLEDGVLLAATPRLGEVAIPPPKNDSSSTSTTTEGNLVPAVIPSPMIPAPTTNTTPIPKLRRSSRNAGVADEHTLHKAERMAMKKNLESPGNSFANFPDSVVISNLGRIGINLAPSDVVVIKNLEVDRLVLSANLKKCHSVATNAYSDDEREERLEAALDHVCGNLNESLLDVENDQILDLSPIRRKKKYNNAKNAKHGKLPKKPKTPSKIVRK